MLHTDPTALTQHWTHTNNNQYKSTQFQFHWLAQCPLTFHNLHWCPLMLHNLHWFHRLSTTYVDSTDSPQLTLMSTYSPQLMLIPLTRCNLCWFHRLSTTYVDSTDSPQLTLMSTDSPQLMLISLTLHNLRWCPLTLHNLCWFHWLYTTYADSTDSLRLTLIPLTLHNIRRFHWLSTTYADSSDSTTYAWFHWLSTTYADSTDSPQLTLIPLTLRNLRWFHIPEFPHQAAQFCRRLAWTVELTLVSSALVVEGRGAPWRVGAAAVGVDGCLTSWGAGLTTGCWKWQLLLTYRVRLPFSYDRLCCWKWRCQTDNAVLVFMLKWKQKLENLCL